jgi:hypothetical protein
MESWMLRAAAKNLDAGDERGGRRSVQEQSKNNIQLKSNTYYDRGALWRLFVLGRKIGVH